MPLRSQLLIVFWVVLYFSPFIAFVLLRRGDEERPLSPLWMFLFVALLGWTVIGWLGAWALGFAKEGSPGSAGSTSWTPFTYPEASSQPRESPMGEGTGMMTCPVCKGMGQQTGCTYCVSSGRVQRL